jgi:transcriptional repressor NrdR
MGMECHYCKNTETKVTDSRDTGSYTIRRRRECLKCNKRFTTYEYIELTPVYIKKKDGRLEKFDRNKIKRGLMKAVEKRPVSHEKLEEILEEIEEKIRRTGSEELESKAIGEYVMDALKETDHVAYIRFASVYRSFADIESFEEEIKNLAKQNVIGDRKAK